MPALVAQQQDPPDQPADLNDQLEFDELGATLYHGNIKRFA